MHEHFTRYSYDLFTKFEIFVRNIYMQESDIKNILKFQLLKS